MNSVLSTLHKKGLQYWLPYYLWKSVCKNIRKIDVNMPVHVVLCIVDHYEPFYSGVDFERARYRVQSWMNGYPKMADKHYDADGRSPQHTWFYPPHLDHIFLEDLVYLCKQGFGDIEMHLHHNHMHPFPDTSRSLRQKILNCIADYSRYGIFCQPDGSKRFAFIHGDWSLDNSLGKDICGVNNEIQILKECGCFADFTFPSLGKSQPMFVNEIFYANDDPLKPKSYNWGKRVCVNGKNNVDLMMIQGIIGLRWKSRVHKYLPSIEASNIGATDLPSPSRLDYLVKNALRVHGNSRFLFIKLHTHGCRESDFDCLFGEYADKMFDYLEQNYNDGKHYILHYVTAREMYNLIKAAEDGHDGNPNKFRNYVIKEYSYLDND